jgi:hypothetical protein
MANRSKKTSKTIGVGITQVHFTFFPNGSSDPVAADIIDPGYTVASVTYASGIYTVTLKDTWSRLVSKSVSYQNQAANVDMYAQFGVIDLAAKTVAIQMKTGATNTAPAAANANHSVSVTLTFQESLVTR